MSCWASGTVRKLVAAAGVAVRAVARTAGGINMNRKRTGPPSAAEPSTARPKRATSVTRPPKICRQYADADRHPLEQPHHMPTVDDVYPDMEPGSATSAG